MLRKTSCHRLITTQVTLRSLIDGIKSELAEHEPYFELHIDEIPSLAEIYPKLGKEKPSDSFEPYPPTTRPPMSDIAIYIHSSGSTGFPKAIPQTHEIMVHWAAFRQSNHLFFCVLGRLTLPNLQLVQSNSATSSQELELALCTCHHFTH
jgi:acyl-CoA synthetase (AMP-forming)/AMP-acid ligase II